MLPLFDVICSRRHWYFIQLSTYDILEEIENYQLSWLSPKYLLKLVQ